MFTLNSTNILIQEVGKHFQVIKYTSSQHHQKSADCIYQSGLSVVCTGNICLVTCVCQHIWSIQTHFIISWWISFKISFYQICTLPGVTNRAGHSPLSVASAGGHLYTVRYLVEVCHCDPKCELISVYNIV